MRRTAAPAGPGGVGPAAGGVGVDVAVSAAMRIEAPSSAACWGGVAVSADAGKGGGAGETGEEEER